MKRPAPGQVFSYAVSDELDEIPGRGRNVTALSGGCDEPTVGLGKVEAVTVDGGEFLRMPQMRIQQQGNPVSGRNQADDG